jgi:hypothetical protein
MNRTTRYGLLAILLAASALSHAQSKKELVQKLLLIQRPGIEAVARALAEQPATLVVQNTNRILQVQVPPEKREATAKAADAEVKKYLEEAVPLVRDKAIQLAPTTIGQILEDKFSADELKQLIAWLDSPLNKKFQQLAPELQNALAQKLVADVRPLIEPKIKTMDTNVAKALGLPLAQPPAAAASAPAAPAKGSN